MLLSVYSCVIVSQSRPAELSGVTSLPGVQILIRGLDGVVDCAALYCKVLALVAVLINLV